MLLNLTFCNFTVIKSVSEKNEEKISKFGWKKQSLDNAQINIFDKKLNKDEYSEKLKFIDGDKHLWGVTILMIASKFNEIEYRRVKIKQLVKRAKKSNYTNEQIKNCESEALRLLNWNIKWITPLMITNAIIEQHFDQLPLNVRFTLIKCLHGLPENLISINLDSTNTDS